VVARLHRGDLGFDPGLHRLKGRGNSSQTRKKKNVTSTIWEGPNLRKGTTIKKLRSKTRNHSQLRGARGGRNPMSEFRTRV